MVKYAVVEFVTDEDGDLSILSHAGKFENIQEAERNRFSFLEQYRDANPQNVQVIQYSE